MSYLKTEVIWSRDGDNLNISGVVSDGVITDWTKITVKKGLDSKSNTVEVELTNAPNRTPLGASRMYHKYVSDSGELLFQEGDVLTIKSK